MEICCKKVHFAIAFLQAWEGLKKEGKIFFWRIFTIWPYLPQKFLKREKIMILRVFLPLEKIKIKVAIYLNFSSS
jgi:hypothetical protein